MPFAVSSVPPRVQVPTDMQGSDDEILHSNLSSPSLSPSQAELSSHPLSSGVDSTTSSVYLEAMDMLFSDTAAYATAINTDDVIAKYMFHPGDNFCWMWISIKLATSFEQALALHVERDLVPQLHPALKDVRVLKGEGERKVELWTKNLPLGLGGELILNTVSSTEHGKWVARHYPMSESEMALLPSTKVTREVSEGAEAVIPIAGKETLFLQCLKFTMPFRPSAFIVRNAMPTCMKALTGPYISGAKKVETSQSCPWKQRVRDNVDGRYTFAEQATIEALGHPLAAEIASVIPGRVRK